MIDIVPDGVPCKKCNTMHPTLYWHKLYDDYMKIEKDYIVYIKELYKKFGEEISDDKALNNYYEHMETLNLVYCEKAGRCAVCKTNTHYKHIKTQNFVCSDKCKYKLAE